MLSLILPTYNESKNIPELVSRLQKVLADISYEIIVVDDDSPDKTWEITHELSESIPELRVIRRIGRRGLSSAVVEGFLAAKGDVFAVMDADGQHDMNLLPELYAAVNGTSSDRMQHSKFKMKNDSSNSGVNIAIGSRYIEGGSVGEWDEQRYLLSRVATKMALALCKVKVKDPMSGFFAIDRETFEESLPRLNPKGFKILLDFLVHVQKETTVKELPFTFASRLYGESKLSWKVQLQFLEYLYDVTFGKYVPITFIKYCIVGALGVMVNLATYYSIRTAFFGEELMVADFSIAVACAIETAIVFNFLLNNIWTFKHSRLTGSQAAAGFVKYNAACLVGAVANYAAANYCQFMLMLPELASVVIGAFTGVFWNYTMSRFTTWRTA